MKGKLNTLFGNIKKSSMAMNYIWVFLGQNVATVFSMLSLIITLRIISAYEYGSLVIIQTYAMLIASLFGFRTFNGVIKYIADAEKDGQNKEIKQYVNCGFIMDAISGILAFIMGIVLLYPVTKLMEWDEGMLKNVFVYFPIVIILPLLNGTPVGILRKLNHFKQANILHAIVYGVQNAMLAVLWLLQSHSFEAVLIVYGLTEVIECIALLIYSIVLMQKQEEYADFWKVGISRDMQFIKYNIYFGITTAMDQLLGSVSTLLINKYMGNLATAYLKVITRIFSLFTKLTTPIGQIIYPGMCEWIAQKNYKRARNTSIKLFWSIIVGGMALASILFVTYDWWIVIFNSAMAGTKIQSLLYMVYTILSVSMICISQLVFALNLVRENLRVVAVFNILYIIALIPAITKMGIYGFLGLQILQLLLMAISKWILVHRRISQLSAAQKPAV